MATELLERRYSRRRRRTKRRIFAILMAVVLVAGGAWLLSLGNAHNEEKRINEVQEKLAQLDWVETDLLPVNDYSRPGTPVREINAIVVHYVGNPGTTAAQNRSYFEGLADSGETRASSNFIIGLEGEIIQCVPISEVAFCSNTRNEDTLSVECCHPDGSGQFNDATYESLVKLTAWLCHELGLDSTDVIRHYDVSGKECPIYFVDNEAAWTTFKADVQSALDVYSSSPRLTLSASAPVRNGARASV